MADQHFYILHFICYIYIFLLLPVTTGKGKNAKPVADQPCWFDLKRNDCAKCKPGGVQCGAPMEKVTTIFVFVFSHRICICVFKLYFYICFQTKLHVCFKLYVCLCLQTVFVFQHVFSVVFSNCLYLCFRPVFVFQHVFSVVPEQEVKDWLPWNPSVQVHSILYWIPLLLGS